MEMVYIHNLRDLNPKTAEVESVSNVRMIKSEVKFPVSSEYLDSKFSFFLITDADKAVINEALAVVPFLVQMINKVGFRKDPVHELINVQRTLKTVQEMPPAMNANLAYIEEIIALQSGFSLNFAGLINRIPKLSSYIEKKECNDNLGNIFKIILRNEGLLFNSESIVNEARLIHIRDLCSAMEKGYLFHFSIRDELAKLSFNDIKPRIPKADLDEAEQLRQMVNKLRIGVEKAYEVNMRMVALSVLLYSYVKWSKGC